MATMTQVARPRGVKGVMAVLAIGLFLLVPSGVFAFDSGGNPGGTGANHIEWTGQGASGGVLNNEDCDNENTPYLLWVFTTDGGSAHDATLHLGGSGSGDYAADTSTGSTFKFMTPYYVPNPNLLTASADFTVDDPGNGAWNLVISHGCPGTPREDQTPPDGHIGGPCADPAYYAVMDNTAGSMTYKFIFRWQTASGFHRIKKYVPVGYIFTTWAKWVKPNTTATLKYWDENGDKHLLDSVVAAKGRYPACDYQPGWSQPPV